MPKYTYEGENNKAGIVAFMKNPGKAPEKPKDENWADTPSDVAHLTDATFHEFVKVGWWFIGANVCHRTALPAQIFVKLYQETKLHLYTSRRSILKHSLEESKFSPSADGIDHVFSLPG